jgi:hypothetical protein
MKEEVKFVVLLPLFDQTNSRMQNEDPLGAKKKSYLAITFNPASQITFTFFLCLFSLSV